MNKALRTENIDILIKMGFFIRDLHRQIENLYSLQEHSSMIVYRGQGMTNHQFEKLCQYKGGLISFQNFLSTSLDKQVSLEFARRAIEKPGLRGIVFRMKIDPKLMNLSNPYASLNKLSYFQNREKEILFSTHTVFRIENIRPIKDENKIWQVNLRLTTNQDDVQLQQLTKHLRQDLQSSSNPWESLAKLLLTMGQFDKAEQIYENILEKTSSNDNEQLAYIYHQLGCVHNEKNNLDQAFQYFQQSLDIKAKYLPEEYNDPQLADTYSNLGSIYHAQGKLDDALDYFNRALQTKDQRILASIYNNIGMVLKRQEQFSNALEYFEKSLEIDLNSLPPTHPDLATTYSNIGRVYSTLKDYSNALVYYQKTLDIRRLSLPQNHPLLLLAITNYENTATILRKIHLESNLSAPTPSKNHSLHLKLSEHSRRFLDKVSNHKQIIKR
jgi:tetratricopeptide (TPR) repeat protein